MATDAAYIPVTVESVGAPQQGKKNSKKPKLGNNVCGKGKIKRPLQKDLDAMEVRQHNDLMIKNLNLKQVEIDTNNRLDKLRNAMVEFARTGRLVLLKEGESLSPSNSPQNVLPTADPVLPKKPKSKEVPVIQKPKSKEVPPVLSPVNLVAQPICSFTLNEHEDMVMEVETEPEPFFAHVEEVINYINLSPSQQTVGFSCSVSPGLCKEIFVNCEEAESHCLRVHGVDGHQYIDSVYMEMTPEMLMASPEKLYSPSAESTPRSITPTYQRNDPADDQTEQNWRLDDLQDLNIILGLH